MEKVILNYILYYYIHFLFFFKSPHRKTSIHFKHQTAKVYWSFLVATYVWFWPLTNTLRNGLLNNDDTRMLLLQWDWGSLFSVQYVQIIFCNNFLFLVLTIDFFYSQLMFLCILFEKRQKNQIRKKKEIFWKK